MSENDVHDADETILVRRVVVGPLDNNVFIVTAKPTDESILIDPADDPELLLKLCTELGIRTALVTHGHGDHVQAAPALRDAGIQIAVAAGDSGMLSGHDIVVDDGDTFNFGHARLRAIATPGHTPGSTCFALEGSAVVFTGDTLFQGGPGRTTSPENFSTIIDSIETRLFDKLPDETIVLPGHGDNTTIAEEKPRLAEYVSRGW